LSATVLSTAPPTARPCIFGGESDDPLVFTSLAGPTGLRSSLGKGEERRTVEEVEGAGGERPVAKLVRVDSLRLDLVEPRDPGASQISQCSGI